MNPDTTPSSNYWDGKIIEWENSMRTDLKSDVSWMERLASRFRKPLKVRSQKCLELIAPHVKDKNVLELGCGSGFFARELCRRASPRRVTGMDISAAAVQRARDLAQEEKLEARMEFLQADAALAELPQADLTLGLGFLDYLSPEEIRQLFQKIKSPYVLFTFSERNTSFYRYLHIVYLKLQGCEKHFYYTPKEVLEFMGGKYRNIRLISGRELLFGRIVHNLP